MTTCAASMPRSSSCCATLCGSNEVATRSPQKNRQQPTQPRSKGPPFILNKDCNAQRIPTVPSSDDFDSSSPHDPCFIRITADGCALPEQLSTRPSNRSHRRSDRLVDTQKAPRWSARFNSKYRSENTGDDILVGVQQVEGAGLAFPLGSERQTISARALSFPGQEYR